MPKHNAARRLARPGPSQRDQAHAERSPADRLRIAAPPRETSEPPPGLLRTAEVTGAAPGLKPVQKYGGRPDRIDLIAARYTGVTVAVMPLCPRGGV